jgi:hypothetical protein
VNQASRTEYADAESLDWRQGFANGASIPNVPADPGAMARHLLPLAPMLCAALAAQAPVTWANGSIDIGWPFHSVNLSGPPGLGAIFVSATVQNPPAATPWGPLRIGMPLQQLLAGTVPPNAPLSLGFALPGDPALLGARLAFTGALVPNGATRPVLSNAFTTRVGALPGLGALNRIPGEQFGRALLLADRELDGRDELLVGVPGSNSGGAAQSGAVAIYAGTPPSLVQVVTALSTPPQAGALGRALASGQLDGQSGIDLVAGEPSWDSPQVTDAGRVHVFLAPGFLLVATLSAPPGVAAAGQGFGTAVHVADLDRSGRPEIVVGAPVEVGPGHGRVHVFDLGVSTQPIYSLLDPGLAQGAFGSELASGDVAGDAALELAVGDPQWAPVGGTNRGRVYVFGGTSLLAVRETPSPRDHARFGEALAIGDLIGDSHADLAVGAPGEGRVYVYAGGPGGLAPTPTITLAEPGLAAIEFGAELLVADADGDGTEDLLASNPLGARIHVWLGTPGGANTFQLTALIGRRDPQLTLFGQALALGDQDGDGRDEVWVGAPAQRTGIVDSGKVFRGAW